MRRFAKLAAFLGVFAALVLLHDPLLRLPYFWDEAGYYIPAALDFYRRGLLVPQHTLPTGHTPVVMVYLALVWRLAGFRPLSTRLAMILLAAATVCAAYSLGRTLAPRGSERERALWGALLLALSPLFFAQSSLAHLDLVAALFTTLALIALLRRRGPAFALAASLAILSKETAVVMLPVTWLFALRENGWSLRSHPPPLSFPRAPDGCARPTPCWLWLTLPLAPLGVWAVYYHHITGFWTGNAQYLQYNLYSTLNPARVLLSLMRRFYEVFLAGFNWLLTAAALAGWWLERGRRRGGEQKPPEAKSTARRFVFLSGGVVAAYILLLSLVGGAILPRYLLPIFPLFFVGAVHLIHRLPQTAARALVAVAAGCFVAGWFINPPYPFPFEDNLAFADFIRLHQQAARFLESSAEGARIATAWPASDELTQPDLGYVTRPLRVAPMEGFVPEDFARLKPGSFDWLYLYSRKWEPADNWLERFPVLRSLQKRYFDYEPQVAPDTLESSEHLTLAAEFELRGQWVRIYSTTPPTVLPRAGPRRRARHNRALPAAMRGPVEWRVGSL